MAKKSNKASGKEAKHGEAAGQGSASVSNSDTSRKSNNISLRGQTFVGIVVSSKPMKSATVEIQRKHFVPKYERYENRITRLHVHNPPHINAKEGDIVKIRETRPLSKTIHHTIVEKVGEELAYKGRKMIEQEEKEKIVKKKAHEEEGQKKSKKKESSDSSDGME